MIDELFDRNYQSGRSDLNAAIARVAGRIGAAVTNAFKVLNRIEFDAPWTVRRSTRRRGLETGGARERTHRAPTRMGLAKLSKLW